MNWNLENLTYDQLDIITDRFILADKVTANEDLTGLGFNETFKKTIIDQVKNVNGKILVINDLGFHITKGLLEKGAEKVYLLMTQFITVNKPKLKKNGEYSYRKNGEISTTKELALDDKKLYNLYKHLPIIRDNDKVVLITAEEFYSMGTEENKFDLIIANPPYNMGNKITKNIIDNINFDEFINLMPLNLYEDRALFGSIDGLPIFVDNKSFKDVDKSSISSLCICKLLKNIFNNKDWILDFKSHVWKEKYREFYLINNNYHNLYVSRINKHRLSENDVKILDNNFGFLFSFRTASNGIEKNGFCAEYNLKHNPLPMLSCEKGNKNRGREGFYRLFNSQKELDNFKTFAYKNVLCNDLILGMNDAGVAYRAIPNIDWSIDRDYEHLTYEELLQIMKDELANQKK